MGQHWSGGKEGGARGSEAAEQGLGDRTSTPRGQGEAHKRPAAFCEGTGLLSQLAPGPAPLGLASSNYRPRPTLAAPPVTVALPPAQLLARHSLCVPG